MSILELIRSNPKTFQDKTIQQIVAFCGDGKLKDDSSASTELRGFLKTCTPDAISTYAKQCLDGHFDKGEKVGFVLQDIVNEIGRRLGYTVTDGLYQGRSNAIGFDGLWSDGEHELIIEVKTSDAYRINLDTIFSYGEKLNDKEGAQRKRRCALVVVGRQDTGDLEAQIRGSRYAWTVRMVSVDALVKLMFLNAELDDQALTDKIRKVLLPFEYTRVDHIIELVFETQQETEASAELLPDEHEPSHRQGSSIDSTVREYNSTPRALLDAKRMRVVGAFFNASNQPYTRKSKTNFSSDDGSVHVSCAVSKRYESDYQPYWYALHPAWLEHIRSASAGYFILGCMDRDEAYAVPVQVVLNSLDKLNVSKNDGGKMHWHIALNETSGKLLWNLSKAGETVDLTPYRFPL